MMNDFDLRDPVCGAEPYPIYRRLRDTDPIHESSSAQSRSCPGSLSRSGWRAGRRLRVWCGSPPWLACRTRFSTHAWRIRSRFKGVSGHCGNRGSAVARRCSTAAIQQLNSSGHENLLDGARGPSRLCRRLGCGYRFLSAALVVEGNFPCGAAVVHLGVSEASNEFAQCGTHRRAC
jgi:hypothetical protein